MLFVLGSSFVGWSEKRLLLWETIGSLKILPWNLGPTVPVRRGSVVAFLMHLSP